MRFPWSTPGDPPVMVAAWRPVSTPSPAASKPISRTDSSEMKRWKIPIALDPPPTHAITASGNLPVSANTCSRDSSPIILWKSRTIDGNGCGPATVPSM